jgi:hypothetical protein
LLNYAAILAYLSEKIKTAYGNIEAADKFLQRHHCCVIVVSDGTRRVMSSGADGLLNEDKKMKLEGACAAFGKAWKANYNRPLTPKGHVVVAHVARTCRGSWTSTAYAASSGRAVE